MKFQEHFSRCARLAVFLPLLGVMAGNTAFGEARARLIEIKDDVEAYQGKLLARTNDQCFLMDSYGAIAQLPMSRMKSFAVLGENFRSSSTGEFRQKLQQEFRAGYEIQSSTHFMVVGKKGSGKAYTSLFEEIYRQVESFYSIRGFETRTPEVTLVAVVLGTKEEFKEYCGRDQVLWSEELRGYYSLKTNRVVLYDDPALLHTITAIDADHELQSSSSTSSAVSTAAVISADYGESTSGKLTALLNSVAGETASTIVHETTHQVGYNIGIHSRIGHTPVWVIEGLATVLEAPGVRTRGKSSQKEKVNSERLNWFNVEFEPRRKPGDLAKLIASDEMFSKQVLDAYSFSWAVSYFLTESPARSRLFMSYLRLIEERDPMKPYSAEDRLKDFQSVFGDIARVEVDLLRSLDRLNGQ